MERQEIIKATVEKVKQAILDKWGSIEDCCTEANYSLHELFSSESYCEEIGLDYMPKLERITATFGELRHEWIKIDGIDYDATSEQVEEPLVNIKKEDWVKLFDDFSYITKAVRGNK